MIWDLFEGIGATLGSLETQLRGPASDPVYHEPDPGDGHDLEEDGIETLQNTALAAGGAWLLSRMLRPQEVSWPRVVLAGVAATILADVAGRLGARRPEPGQEPYADDPEELMARLGAGVALTAGYAALLYPRIPGPPLFRGLAFGALEIAAAPRGGLVRLAMEAPGVKFPLQAIALPIDEDAGPLSHLAFGLALGLLYRYEPRDDDMED